MSISGSATKEGTARYAERFPKIEGNASYKRYDRKTLSSLGLGTYLGVPTDDSAYETTITAALQGGINVIDTAINYRHMRSERVVGKIVAKLIADGNIKRDEIFISTKGGYLSFDCDAGLEQREYLDRTFIQTGLVAAEDIGAVPHSLSPKFLEHQLNQSLKNLGLETIDLYYLHNPETQLNRLTREAFLNMLEQAFSFLEKAVAEKKIAAYGIATWNGFRLEERDREYLSLGEVLQVASKVAGDKTHNFKAVQAPLNLSRPEALNLKTQATVGKTDKNAMLFAAAHSRIGVFGSAPLDQGKLVQHLPMTVHSHFPGLATDAQRALQFARSCPAISSTLVGVRTLPHLKELLQLLEKAPTPGENFVRFYEKSMVTAYSS